MSSSFVFCFNYNCSLNINRKFLNLYVTESQFHIVNFSSSCRYLITEPDKFLRISILTENDLIARPSIINYRSINRPVLESCYIGRFCTKLKFKLDRNYFYVDSNQVGITKFLMDLSLCIRNSCRILDQHSLQINVIRPYRLFDDIFDYSSAVISCILALSVGLSTDTEALKQSIFKPSLIIMTVVVQHLIIPLVAFCISITIQPSPPIIFGFCAMAAIPGGGLSHLIVFLIGADRSLSTSISMLNTLFGGVFLILWLLFISWYVSIAIKIEIVVLWLSSTVLAHLSGFGLRLFQAKIGEAILTWICKPILLFSAILLMTLGIYINHYAFDNIDYQVLLILTLMVFGGYMIGGLAGFITHHKIPMIKTIAIKNSIFDCLILIPALRAALSKPLGDLAAIVPLWGVFFTPVPMLFYFILHKLKFWIIEVLNKRKTNQIKEFGITTNMEKLTRNINILSIPLLNELSTVTDSQRSPVTETV